MYFEHTLIHTGQNFDYELNQIFFEEMGIRKPDYYLDVVEENLGKTLGNIIDYSYQILKKLNPDALLVLGDTNSGLSALSAKRLKIPVFHLEAGNRCFDENLPEEINRRIIDHISDVNLCYTEHARRYLNAEGIAMDRTFVVGSPMAEVLEKHKINFTQSKILHKLNLEKFKYILLSAHREENIDIEGNFNSLIESINFLAEKYKLPIIYSVHPRSANALETKGIKFSNYIKSLKPLGFLDYIKLQSHALCVVSDSGTLAEEASILRFPAVSIRTSTERPEAIDNGNLIIGNIDKENLISAVELAVKTYKHKDYGSSVENYEEQNTAIKVIKTIQSFTSIINQKVWLKPNLKQRS
jgi:UDP-N-acetylglucosamine 2-epimerase (non-hydrolysing)